MSTHLLELSSEGFFATGTCTGCPWRESGSAPELRRSYERHHESDAVVDEPRQVDIPPVTGDQYLCLLEQQIIYLLAHHVRVQSDRTLFVVLGLATARSLYLRQPDTGWTDQEDPGAKVYVSNLTARITHLHKRQQAKLCVAARGRASQQDILMGGNG